MPSAEGGRRAKSGTSYKAFISYSHAMDSQLARALQSGLHQFAKPWYRLRAVRLFRDIASLSADPGLWSAIERGLAASELFVLLASPSAAASTWVQKETSWWLSHKPKDTVLIVLTDGEIEWNEASGDFDWERSSALPGTLEGAFSEEPRFVDLRWTREAGDLSLRDARFRECVADLAATLQHRSKDDLLGEDVRQHRRALRLARSAIAVLTALVVLTSSLAVVAARRTREARAQRREATAQARLATSRALSTAATNVADQQFDLSMLLAVLGYRTILHPTPQTRATLLAGLERNPQHLALLRPGGGPVSSVAVTADGRRVASGDSQGNLTLWDTATFQAGKRLNAGSAGRVTSIALSGNDQLVAWGTQSGEITIWNLERDRQISSSRGEAAVNALSFSPNGQHVAAGDADGTVALWEVAGGRQVWKARHGPTNPDNPDRWAVDRVAFSADSQSVFAGGLEGSSSAWSTATGAPIEEPQLRLGFVSSSGPQTFSEDGLLFAETAEGIGQVESTRHRDWNSELFDTPRDAESLAFSPDNRLLAVGGHNAVRLFDVDATALGSGESEPAFTPGTSAILTGYPGPIAAMAFSSDHHLLAVATGDVVVVSDLNLNHRLGGVVAEAHEVCHICQEVSLSVSPDGGTIAWLVSGPGAQKEVRLWDFGANRETGKFPVSPSTNSITFEPDGRTLVSTSPPIRWDLQGRRLSESSRPEESTATLHETSVGTSFLADGRPLIWYQAFEDGGERWSLSVRDMETGELRAPPWQSDHRIASATSRSGLAAVGLHDSIDLWDLRAGRQVGTLKPSDRGGDDSSIDALALSDNGRVLASLSQGTITLWDVPSRQPRSTLALGRLATLRLSPRGDLLVAGDANGSITVWELESNQRLGVFEGPPPQDAIVPVSLAFLRDGKALASGVPGGGLMLWELDDRSWLARACSLGGRDVTGAEWQFYAGSQPRQAACP